uniref:F-box domain-containing protein n=1 Tax=Psilocybe cubensis TaxID=181762 RepID=A0A8H8CIC7_PSICU
MALLEALIGKAQKDLHELLNRHRALRESKNMVHEPIIHQLPPEVSAMIFQLALPNPRKGSRPGLQVTRPVTTPFTFGAVCKTWRNVAWSSPYLWSQIPINIGPIIENNTSYFDVVKGWFDRTGGLPLTIYVYSKRQVSDQTRFLSYHAHATSHDLKPLATLINKHLYQCRELEIDCSGTVLPHLRGNAPILQNLRIISDVHWSQHQISDASRYADLIHFDNTDLQNIRVSLHRCPLKALSVNSEAITHFEGAFTSIQEFLEILDAAPQLVECSWNLIEPSRAHTSVVKAHQTIKSFKLKCSTHEMEKIFSSLALPVLSHLELDTRRTILPHAQIHLLLKTSTCNLTSLTLKNIQSDGEDIIAALKAMPSIRKLELLGSDFTDYEPEVLFIYLGATTVPQDDQEPFLPDLQDLTIEFYADTGFPWTHIPVIFGTTSDMIHPRRRPLKSLHIIHKWSLGNHWARQIPAKSRIKETIAAAGVTLDFRDVYYDLDLLLISMERYAIDVPSWYNSKERVRTEHDVDYETDSAASEGSAVETDEDAGSYETLSTEDSDEDDVASNLSELSYDPEYDLPVRVTGETTDLVYEPPLEAPRRMRFPE